MIYAAGMFKSLLVSLTLLAFAPAVAHASDPAPHPAWWDSRSALITETYWEVKPNPIQWRTTAEFPLFGEVTPAGGLPAAYGGPELGIVFKADRKWTNWCEFLTVRLHEQGHVMGYSHSDEEGNVMYPSLSIQWDVCERRGRSFLEGNGVLPEAGLKKLAKKTSKK